LQQHGKIVPRCVLPEFIQLPVAGMKAGVHRQQLDAFHAEIPVAFL
jgi:hypothetical protein